MDFNVLPEEILTRIFKNMTAKERNPIRKTCRRWMVCCNRLELLRSEKLHFRCISYLADSLHTLVMSGRLIMNLKFSDYHFTSPKYQIFWQRFGRKVEQLELENCFLSDSALEDILVNCPNLSYLVLGNVYSSFREYRDYTGRIFIKVKDRKIVARNVKTLILKNPQYLNKTKMLSLVSIFPNVINLELDFPSVELLNEIYGMPPQPREINNAIAEEIDEEKENPHTCYKFVECLATNLRLLENLSLKTADTTCKCVQYVQEINFSRLKTVKAHTDLPFYYRVRANQAFFPQACTWTTGSLSDNLTAVVFNPKAKAKEIISALQRFKGLRKIQVTLKSVADVCQFYRLYETIANSRLVSINIENELNPEWAGSIPKMLQDKGHSINSTVRDLVIDNHARGIFISIFLRCFTALTRLELTINDKTSDLDIIFFQTNLKSLRCVELKSGPFYGGDPYTLTAMGSTSPALLVENVEYLRIEIALLKELFVKQPSIFFSNLRYLHITRRKDTSSQNEQLPLLQLELRCIPLYNLEQIYVNVDDIFDDIFTLFSKPTNFPKLQSMIMEVHKDQLDYHKNWFKSWFEHCPCLREISMIYADNRDYFYRYYDPIRREVREHLLQRIDSDCFNWRRVGGVDFD